MMNFKNMIVVLGFILTPFLFVGCSAVQTNYAIDAGMVGMEITSLKNRYAEVEKAIRQAQIDTNMFTQEEWRTLANVDSTIDMLILKYSAMVQFNFTEVALEDIKFMYGLAVDGYTQGRTVVYNHWDEFQPSIQVMLNSYDKSAVDMSTKVKSLLNNPSNTNINESLTLIAGVLSSFVKMMGLIVI